MGSGIIISCCHRSSYTEPEILSTQFKLSKRNSINSNSNYKISMNDKNINYINIKPHKVIDRKLYFINKIKKIGNILNCDFINSLPIDIQNYIKANPYEEIEKNTLDNSTYSFTKNEENINFFKPIQLKNNNIIYLGEWTKEGIINGRGKMYKPETETYIEGIWVNGSLKYGRIINIKSVYIGDIEDNQFHGKGKYIEFKGNIYEGYFTCGEKNGNGKCIFSDGCTYEGDFENNEMNGKGEFNWTNGICYKGEFYKGIFHGNGLLRWRNGNVYNGEFKKGFFCGKGIFFWKNEEEYYKGEYLNNNKNGKGLYKFKNGDIYIGQWINSKPSGKGTYETKNKIYTGIWKQGNNIEILDIVSKYQSGEINENINFNFNALNENIDISVLEHINVKMMIEIN